jgi:hypothetical protein
MLRCVALVRTDVSERPSASTIHYGHLCSQITDSCHHYDGGARFLRNVVSYESHIS